MSRLPVFPTFFVPSLATGTALAILILLGVASSTPTAAETLALNELWRIGGEEESEDYLIGVISGVATDQAGQIYLLDAQLNEVMVLSPEGEYLRSIGREGEGPGEFSRPQDIFRTSDGLIAVVQRFPGKIRLVQRGMVDVRPLATHLLPLERIVEAFEMVAAYQDGVLRAVIQVSE